MERFKAIAQWEGSFKTYGHRIKTAPMLYSFQYGGFGGFLSLFQSAPLVWDGVLTGTWSNNCKIDTGELNVRGIYINSSNPSIVLSVPARLEISNAAGAILTVNGGDTLWFSDVITTDVYDSINGGVDRSTQRFDYDWNGPFGEVESFALPDTGFHINSSQSVSSTTASPCMNGDIVQWTKLLYLIPKETPPEEETPPEPYLCGTVSYDPAIQCCDEGRLSLKYPIAELEECPRRTQRSNPLPNGCGTNGHKLPDRLLNVDWKWACDEHDRCYSNCSTSKERCDSAFEANIAGVCFDGTLSPVWAAICYSAASAAVEFPFSVITGEQDGYSAFIAAQREACKCCP